MIACCEFKYISLDLVLINFKFRAPVPTVTDVAGGRTGASDLTGYLSVLAAGDLGPGGSPPTHQQFPSSPGGHGGHHLSSAGQDDPRFHGTELVMLYDYKVSSPAGFAGV